MRRKIAVVGGTPTWRRGIGASLADSGFTPVDLAELGAWRPGRGGMAVVVWMGDAGALDEVSAFDSTYPAIPVVGVVPALEVGALATALRAGATAVLDEAAPTPAFGHTIEAALGANTVLPKHLAVAMATRVPTTPDAGSWVDETEASWLRDLASGTTVAGLAERIGYSERETFRMLNDLYEKIGVRNRTEAIIWAARHGLLPD